MAGLTNEILQELFDSLGLSSADETETRFDAIHMHGIQEMTTQDIFDYFGRYGPASIEWINDTSCNVVWHDRISVARALLALSKPIKGLSAEKGHDPEKDDDKFSKGRSILLVKEGSDQDKDGLISRASSVDVSEINASIPPGHWRFGDPHEKARYILLRYARRTDKRPFR